MYQLQAQLFSISAVIIAVLILAGCISPERRVPGNNQITKMTDKQLCTAYFSDTPNADLKSSILQRQLLKPEDINSIKSIPKYPVVGMKVCFLYNFPGLKLRTEDLSRKIDIYDYKPCENGSIFSLFSENACENLIITVDHNIIADIKCIGELQEQCRDRGYLSQLDAAHIIKKNDTYTATYVLISDDFVLDTKKLEEQSIKYFGVSQSGYPNKSWIFRRIKEISQPLFNRFFVVPPKNYRILDIKLNKVVYSVQSLASINCAEATVELSINGKIVYGESDCSNSNGNYINPKIITKLSNGQKGIQISIEKYMNSLYSIAINRALLNGLSKAFQAIDQQTSGD